MNRLALLSLVLLGGLGGSPPKPEKPKLPAVPEREAVLLSPPHALPDEPHIHQLDTAIRHARRQAREIDAYLFRHTADRAEELRRHRLALLDFADRWAATPAISPPFARPVVEADTKHREWVAYQQTPTAADTRPQREPQRPSEPPPAPLPSQPKSSRPPKPKPPPVRCPRRYCLAAPGKPCRGRSGDTAPTHPERERASKRKEIFGCEGRAASPPQEDSP